jgi:hypothetical protein
VCHRIFILVAKAVSVLSRFCLSGCVHLVSMFHTSKMKYVGRYTVFDSHLSLQLICTSLFLGTRGLSLALAYVLTLSPELCSSFQHFLCFIFSCYFLHPQQTLYSLLATPVGYFDIRLNFNILYGMSLSDIDRPGVGSTRYSISMLLPCYFF